MNTCRWIVREGKGFKYWAFTTCKQGFNPLSRASTIQDIKEYYDGRMCPICKNVIEIDLKDVERIETE